MADQKTVADVYRDQNKSFLKHLKSARELEEEKIHKLRVDVKKLRSLFKFLEALSKKDFDKKKAMKLISPVFKSAGKIRTATLNLELVSHYRRIALLGFKIYLKEKEKEAKKIFLQELKAFDKKEFSKLHKKILENFKKQNQKSLGKNSEKYINELLSKISNDMPDISNDEYFHDIRKKLKDVKTISGLLEEIAPHSISPSRQKSVETIEEKIGRWHDTVTLVQELEKFISQNKSTKGSKDAGKKNKDNEKLSILAIDLTLANEANKKIIAIQLKKNLF
jgi:CHAD domain-containing protein